jgi:hypothetical protein
MAFPVDFRTTMELHNLRSDCESCHFCTGTGCTTHDAPQNAPVDREGVCKDWIDAETRRSIDGKRKLCLKCGKVKHISRVRKGGCELCLGIRQNPNRSRGKGRQDGEICPRCQQPGYYNKERYLCVDCESAVRKLQRYRRYAKGFTCRGTRYQDTRVAEKMKQRAVELQVVKVA